MSWRPGHVVGWAGAKQGFCLHATTCLPNGQGTTSIFKTRTIIFGPIESSTGLESTIVYGWNNH